MSATFIILTKCSLILLFSVVGLGVSLTVGCNNGEMTLWEAGIREKLGSKPFKIWDIQACTLTFQVCTSSYESAISWFWLIIFPI